MTQKILVAYVSKRGSTQEVAAYVANILREQGADVTIMPAKEVSTVAGYDAVVLGTAIRIGSMLGDAVKFVEKHQGALRQVPVAYFTCGVMIMNKDEEQQAQVAGYLDPVRDLVPPVADANFAGKLARPTLNLIEKLLTNVVKPPEGDHRDWDTIRNWSEQVAAKLQVPAAR